MRTELGGPWLTNEPSIFSEGLRAHKGPIRGRGSGILRGGAGRARSRLPASHRGRRSLAGFGRPRPLARRGGYWAARSLPWSQLLGERARAGAEPEVGRGLGRKSWEARADWVDSTSAAAVGEADRAQPPVCEGRSPLTDPPLPASPPGRRIPGA